ncbi:MAG: T9SS type A sorting domain-containing protein [Bacteroidota bacterium]|nr:T9SS type A sorting domain-containing protein [Bacteroidota bacterium]MDX5470109.1 T9SS type A sorting domain-containing protein [Bacteroidota bacterium]
MAAHAQKWTEVSDPLATREVYMAKAHAGQLWLLDDGDAFSGAKAQALRLKNWNNTVWQSSPVYQPSGIDSIRGGEMIGFDTSIYVSYQSYFNGVVSAGVVRYDILSQNWKEISSLNNALADGSRIEAMVVYNNDIYIAGNLLNASGENILYRIKHDFAFAEAYGRVSGEIKDLANYAGSLYYGGAFDSIGASGNLQAIPNLAIMLDDVFTAYSGSAGSTQFLKTLNKGDLVFQEIRQAEERYFNFLSPLGDRSLNYDYPVDFEIRDAALEKNLLFSIQNSTAEQYPAGVYYLNEQKKSWTRMQSKLNPLRSVFVNTSKFLYLVELGENSYHIEQSAFGVLKGRVFVDIDEDCAKSAGDVWLNQHLMIQDVNSGQLWSVDPITGTFEAFVPAGTYHFVMPNLPKRLSDQICGLNKNVQINHGDSVQVDIPLRKLSPDPAVKIQILSPLGFRARQGFEEEYYLEIYNEGALYQKCNVQLKMPDAIRFTRADIMPSDSNGSGTYTWNVNLPPFQMMRVHFRGEVDVTTPSYSLAKFTAWSDPVCLKSDNTDSLVVEVRGAFDPNDKQNFPSGEVNSTIKEIKYHIRFQNTGTDTAYRVTIVDTIDFNLMPIYFRVINTSHRALIDIKVIDNVQYFTFDDILLPDSSVDFDGSQGFVTYIAGVRPNIDKGDSITNKAYIYFDYQKAIETNQVSNVIIEEESFVPAPIHVDPRFKLYPNPSNGRFTISNLTDDRVEAYLYDALGRQLGQYTLEGKVDLDISLPSASQGMYILRIPQWNAYSQFLIAH